MLTAVVHGGEQHPARIPGVKVGGKTGTSQKLVRGLGYQGHRKRYASFVGIAPIDDPRFVIGVMIDSPKDRYGAIAAGQVFRQVGHYALDAGCGDGAARISMGSPLRRLRSWRPARRRMRRRWRRHTSVICSKGWLMSSGATSGFWGITRFCRLGCGARRSRRSPPLICRFGFKEAGGVLKQVPAGYASE